MTHDENCDNSVACDCDNPVPITRPVTPHDKLSKKLEGLWHDSYKAPGYMMLRNVVELHKPEHSQSGYRCTVCFIDTTYPCPTIQAIEKELG